MNKLELQLGEVAKNDNEIVICANVAEDLCRQYQLSSLEEVLNMSLNLRVDNQYSLEVTITGITYQENQNENIIFFKDGVFTSYLIDCYQMNKSQLKYLYIYFLTDGSVNEQNVSNDINQLLGSQNSEFIRFTDSLLNANAIQYKDYSLVFYFIIVFIILILVVSEIFVLFMNQRKYEKELKLMIHYDLPYRFYLVFPLLLIFGLISLIYTVLYSKVCQYINLLANHYGFHELIKNDLFVLILSLVLSILAIFIIEVIFYVSKARKYNENI